MKVTTKGQVTIPREIREQFGILPHTEVRFIRRGQKVYLEKIKDDGRGRALVEHMRGRGTGAMTTDEIMALTRGE